MARLRWTARLVVGLLAARASAAQELAQVCAAAGKVTVGQWASYSGNGGQMNGTTLRLAVVGSERHGDTTFYWFEIDHTSGKDAARSEIVEMLVPGFGVEASEIRGLIVKLGAAPALRVDQMKPTNPVLEFARRCAGAQALGWETVAAPVGSVRALHAKDAQGWEAWVSQDVPFGFVKLRAQDGGDLVLTGRGTDAKSSITETPQQLPWTTPRP